MKRLPLVAALLTFASGAALACEIPTVVEIPETRDLGNRGRAVASDTEQYLRDMVDYVACLKDEIEAAGGEDSPALLQSLLVQRNNAAVAEVKAIVELYEARIGPLDEASMAEAVRGADDIRRTGAAPPVQSRAP